MKKNNLEMFIGFAMVVVGIGFIGDMFEVWTFNLFFDGWWTLFIIVPSLMNMQARGVNIPNVVGVLVGIVLCLNQQNVLQNVNIVKMLFPSVLILLGGSILWKLFFSKGKNISAENNPQQEAVKEEEVNEEKTKKEPMAKGDDHTAIFSICESNYAGVEYKGGKCMATFGEIEIDLKNAIINKDYHIECRSILGRIKISLPKNVKVSINSFDLMGGMKNDFVSSKNEDAPVLYIQSTCILGNVEIK